MPIIESPPETPLVLDTDIFSRLRNKKEYVLANIKNHFSNTKQFPAITSITVFESMQGIEGEFFKNNISFEQANLYRQRIDELIQVHRVLSFDQKPPKLPLLSSPD